MPNSVKPKLALLSDLHNGDDAEDRYIAEQLSAVFDIQIVNLEELPAIEDTVVGIFYRNIWPDLNKVDPNDYRAHCYSTRERLTRKAIPTYNPPECKADMWGKQHVVDLFNHGFPVIPTVSHISDIDKLGGAGKFILKPMHGLDGLNQVIGDKTVVTENWNDNFLIQPIVDFTEEIQFVFVDNKFIYAFSSPHRLKSHAVKYYEPTPAEIAIAARFVEWNKVPHSLQRVDLCRTKDNQLLLMEIEDVAPFLWLLEMPHLVRDEFILRLQESLLQWVAEI